jgi:glycerophosphoryl diester phosphodiesterase
MNWATLDGLPPEIIAHRGASGLLPEHTLAGYALALAQDADVIEPDLIASADGVLFCRHEPQLARSTDVASRAEFADRARDGVWLSTDFSAAELDTLRAIQPFPGRSHQHDGEHPLPRFAAMLDWAAQAAAARGRPLTLYPEIKQPGWFATRGCDPLPPFIAAARALPPGVALRLQCFERDPLRQLFETTGLPCTRLLDVDDDWRAVLAADGGWLAALGVNKRMLWRDGADSGLLAAAHAAGVRIAAWTYRDDQPAADGASIEDELRAALLLGVDALFCDFPATAVGLRNRIAASARPPSR